MSSSVDLELTDKGKIAYLTRNLPLGKTIFSEYGLPGTLEKPSSCRNWLPSFFCPNCSKPHLRKGDCKQAGCPDCKDDWRYIASKGILKHLLSYEFDKNEYKIKRTKRIRHFSLSPPKEDYPTLYNGEKIDVEELEELFNQAYEIAKEKGVEGGLILLHLSRPKDSERDNFKGWKWVSEQENWEDYTYYSPHFHILAVCDKDKKFEAGKDSDKWNWNGISEVSNSNALGRCVMYLLSHAGILSKNNFSPYRYFGKLSCSLHSFDGEKTGVDSDIKRFVKSLMSKFFNFFSQEDFEGLKCSECGEELLHITTLDKNSDYWSSFTDFQKKRLERAYNWFTSKTVPPPGLKDKSDFEDWLNFELEDSSSSVGLVENIGGEKFE